MPPKRKPVQKRINEKDQVEMKSLVSEKNQEAIAGKNEDDEIPVGAELSQPHHAKKQTEPVDVPKNTQHGTEDCELLATQAVVVLTENKEVIAAKVQKEIDDQAPSKPLKKTRAARPKKPLNDPKAIKSASEDNKDVGVIQELDPKNVVGLKTDEECPKELESAYSRRGIKRGAPKADDVPSNSVSETKVSEKEVVSSRTRRGGRMNVQAAKETPKAEHGMSGDEVSDGSDVPLQEEKKVKKKRGKKDEKVEIGKKNGSEPDEKKQKIEEVNYECEKENKKGEKWNLKISTWNVAGLRAWVKKNGVDYVKEEDADIICFQETKCPENKIPPEAKVEGYHTFWVNGKKDGYAGVALYSKEQPLNVTYGINNQEHDDEGRLITAEFEKFFLVTTYVPNAGQGLKTLPKRMRWDGIFRDYLKNLDAKKPVILCGDLNVAHEEIDLANPKTNTKHAGFTKEERENMTALLKEGFVDTFRQLYPDKTGCYTFWSFLGNARSRNTGWRLDYFVVSERLMDSVCDVAIRSNVLGSDHCPVTLFIHI